MNAKSHGLGLALILVPLAACAVPPQGPGSGRPPMPGGFQGYQQPHLPRTSGAPPATANVQAAAQWAGQPAYAPNPAGQWQSDRPGQHVGYGQPPAGYGQAPAGYGQVGASAPNTIAPNLVQNGGSAHAMPGSALAPQPAAQPIPWPVPGGAPAVLGGPNGWGTPGGATGATGAQPDLNQHWPYGGAPGSGAALDPWAATPAAPSQSKLVLPQAATATGDAIAGAVDALKDLATGARPVPPGSTGLDKRSVYDTDGGAARAPAMGSVGTLDGPARELEMTGSGRLYLLEMYQQALDEREALEIEVGSLTARLEQLQARTTDLETRLTDGDTVRAELESTAATLREENQDLAGRLVTAQIRRLEAEKMLIEARIEQERSAAPASENAPRPGAALQPANAPANTGVDTAANRP